MNDGLSFSVECSTESIDNESELYLLFQCFDNYNQKNKMKLLKQELPKIKVYVKIDEEVAKFSVTNKTIAKYTKVPSNMKNILSINYD